MSGVAAVAFGDDAGSEQTSTSPLAEATLDQRMHGAAVVAPTWHTLPAAAPDTAEWAHPGIAVDPAGTVFGADPAGGAVVVRGAGGDVRERIGVPLLEVHGVTHDAETAALWLADPGFKMRPPRYEPEVRHGTAGRLDLATREFTALAQPDVAAYAEQPWRPTAVACAGDGVVAVADGYGAGLVHVFDDTGHRTTLDGTGSGTPFHCPHDVAVVGPTAADQELVVADRGNKRLVYFGLDGTYHRSHTDPLFRSPTGLAVLDDTVLVADVDGALLRVPVTGGTVTELVPFPTAEKRPGWPNHERAGVTQRPELTDGVLNSPHAVASAPNGSIYLAEYVIGGREIHLIPTAPT